MHGGSTDEQAAVGVVQRDLREDSGSSETGVRPFLSRGNPRRLATGESHSPAVLQNWTNPGFDSGQGIARDAAAGTRIRLETGPIRTLTQVKKQPHIIMNDQR
jgi:hypothetical protein